MDLELYLRVLWRFRLLVAGGVLLGLLVFILAIGSPTFNGGRPSFEHRTPTVWSSEALVLVTQPGFPIGRSAFDPDDLARYADPNRLTTLAMVYAEVAKGDAVRELMTESETAGGAPPPGAIEVRPRLAADNSSVLPMLTVTATSTSSAIAQQLALDTTTALERYLAEEQRAAAIPAGQRVEIELIRRPSGAVIVDEPSIVRPMFLFMLIVIATVGLAFVLENLRPRPRPELAVARPPEPERLARTQPGR